MRRVLIALIVAAISVACGKNYSNGDRIGVVTKLSYKGVAMKSWEGEMLVALPAGVSAIQPEVFAFNVDAVAVNKVKAAMDSGKRVRLVYRQWLIAPWSIDHGHVVTDVQDVQ